MLSDALALGPRSFWAEVAGGAVANAARARRGSVKALAVGRIVNLRANGAVIGDGGLALPA